MAKSRNPTPPDDARPEVGKAPAEGGAPSDAEHVPIAPEQADGTSGSVADDDLLAAVTSISPETVSGIDLTLEHLTASTDLFDVPPLDFDGSA